MLGQNGRLLCHIGIAAASNSLLTYYCLDYRKN